MLLASGEQTLFVYDYGDSRTKAFSFDGALLWSSGGRGEGPGEFVNAFDVEVDAQHVWVVDEGAGRITLLDTSAGEYRRQIPMKARLFRDVVPLPGGNALGLLVGVGEDFILHVDSAGEIVGSFPFPTEELSRAPYLLRQPMAAVRYAGRDLDRPEWVVMFPYGDVFFSYAGAELICAGRLMRARSMVNQPDNGQPLASAADIAVTDTSALIIAADSGEFRLRIIDEYDSEDCRYLGSYRLPIRARALSYSDGMLFVQHQDPAPGILALRPSR